MCWQSIYRRLISKEEHIISPRNMTKDCCSPACLNWDECDALGYLDFVKIVIQDPTKGEKDWCEGLTLQNLQGTMEESQNI